MMRVVFVSLVHLTLFVGCSADTPYSRVHSDSGIRGPSYAAITESMKQLEREYPHLVSVVNYGVSRLGRDLNVVKIGHERTAVQEQVKRPAVLITGATHGDEYLNIEDRLPRWFAENGDDAVGVARFLKAGGIIYVVPIFNPDGYESRKRSNAGGVDLNRDFDVLPSNLRKFSQSETTSFTRYLDQEVRDNNLQLKITMDYHCCMGALVYPWGFSKDPLPRPDLEEHVAIANVMNSALKRNYPHGATYDLLRYLSEGSSKDYYYSKYGALAFTFEGAEKIEDKNFAGHANWWNRMLGDLSK